MKKNLFFAIAIMATMLFTSCYQVCYENPLDNRPGQVAFTGTVGGIQTRVSGETWTPWDRIGIFALESGTALTTANIFRGAENIVFHTPLGNGNFSVVNPAEAIIFPAAPDELDFIAYYPHTTLAPGVFALPVNVTNQTPSRNIDLLWTHTAGHDYSNPNVLLEFDRKMSQLRLNVTAAGGSGIDLTGLTIRIDGLRVDGSMNLTNGEVTAGTTINAIQAPVTGNATSASSHSILVPDQNFSAANITFTLADGTELQWLNTPSLTLESGLYYSFDFVLQLDPLPRLQPEGATIGQWQPGYTGSTPIELDPTPTFEVTTTGALSLDETGGAIVVNVVADASLVWVVQPQPGQPWLNVSATDGTGNGNFTIAVPANTGGARTATVTIVPIGTPQPKVITITQEKDPAATQSLVFNETFGAGGVGNVPIADYAGWVTTTDFSSQAGVTFVGTTGSDGLVDIRTSSASPTAQNFSGGGNVMFSAASGGRLYINNIIVCGTQNLLLSFGTNQTDEVISVSYRVDGAGDWSSPLPFTKTTTTWGWVNDLPIHLPFGANNVSLRFTAGNTQFGARIDDVTIITYDTPNGGC